MDHLDHQKQRRRDGGEGGGIGGRDAPCYTDARYVGMFQDQITQHTGNKKI